MTGLPTCGRCGTPFERLDAKSSRCDPCQDIVTRQIAADAKRREPRFPSRDQTGQVRW